MHYKNLKGKYTIAIMAVSKESNEMHILFKTPIEDFGGTLMRVIKDSVAEKLFALDKEKENIRIKHAHNQNTSGTNCSE